jgi:hypothetical protein
MPVLQEKAPVVSTKQPISTKHIDLGAGSEIQAIKLIEIDTFKHKQKRHLALSHCRGLPNMLLKTTQSVFCTYLKGISGSDLPKSSKDAV